MRKIVSRILLSADGVFEDPIGWGAFGYADEAYRRDGLGMLDSCEAKLMGRPSYELLFRGFSTQNNPWGQRLKEMKKYVFSSTLQAADWNNSTIVRGDAIEEVRALKNQEGGDLLIWGHGRFGEALLQNRLIDLIELMVHPVIVGRGKTFFREGQQAKLKLVSVQSFSQIAKLSYEPQY
jgi:dihydrofolate reductase